MSFKNKRNYSLSKLDNLETGLYEDYVHYPDYSNNMKKVLSLITTILISLVVIVISLCLIFILSIYNFIKDYIY